MSFYLNDGSADAPKLRIFLNLDNLLGLAADSVWPGDEALARYNRLAGDGFEGVQITDHSEPPLGAPIPHCGLDRISTPVEADGIIAKHAARGDLCMTVHAGWGIEEDDEVFSLVDSILKASEKHKIPVFLETHRATITQDIWRTVRITREFPEILFNGDFSHYYCGQELVYGDWETKMAFMEPIFSRIAFMHGRIASPGCMQVPINTDDSSRPDQSHGVTDYLIHFKDLWIRAMQGFLRSAGPGDVLIFAPELLSGMYYYARLFPNAEGKLIEESDRYAQALQYKSLAQSCFEEAKQLM